MPIKNDPDISSDIDMYKIVFPLTVEKGGQKGSQKGGQKSVPSSSQEGIGDPFDNYEKFSLLLSQACPNLVPSSEIFNIVMELYMLGEQRIVKLMAVVKERNRTRFRNNYISPLMDEGLLKMKFPKNPNHPHQQYSLSEKGSDIISKMVME